TEAEIQFLVRQARGSGWVGERVELNAMTSPQFITFLEGKLQEQGVTKLVPVATDLQRDWDLAVRTARLNQALAEAQQRMAAAPTAPLPPGLREQLAERIKGSPVAWDAALWDLARRQGSSGGDLRTWARLWQSGRPQRGAARGDDPSRSRNRTPCWRLQY